MLAESEGLGVGFTPLRMGSVKVGDASFLAASLPKPADACCILRHPGVESIDPALLMEASSNLQRDHFNLSYSDLRDLAQAADLPAAAARTAQGVLGLFDLWRAKDVRPGPFCSELVGAYFANLNLEVVVGKGPEEISPNALAGENSALVKVEGILIEANEAEEPTGFDEEPKLSREQLLPHLVRQSATMAAASEQMADIREVVDCINMEARTESRRRHRDLHQELTIELVAAENTERIRDVRVLYRLIGLSQGLWRLGRRIEESEKATLRNAEDGIPDLRPFVEIWGKYEIELTRLFHDFLRYTALRQLRRVREHSRSAGILQRGKLDRHRRKIVRTWQSAKSSREATVNFITSLSRSRDG